MCSGRPEIPGYYWDSERQKYFKITKTHKAHTDQEKKYTQSSISRQSRQQPATSDEHVGQSMAAARSSAFLPGLDLRNRIDGLPRDEIRRAYLRLFERHQAPQPVSPDLDQTHWRVDGVDWDPQSRTLWACSTSDHETSRRWNDGRVTRIAAGLGGVFAAENGHASNDVRHLFLDVVKRPLKMAVVPGVGLATLQFQGTTIHPRASRVSVHVVRDEEMSSNSPDARLRCIELSYFVPRHELSDHSAISVPPPCHGPARATVSLKTSLTLLDLESGRATREHDFPSDIISTEWLQPLVSAAGLRSGAVLLWDFRACKGVVGLKHGGSVAHLARVDESGTQLAVAGVPNSLALYDLRMVRETAPSHSNGGQMAHSQSVWKVAHRNAADLGLGFSLMREVIAAAQDDGTLGVYSSKTGALLHTLGSRQSIENPSLTFRTVKVIEDDLNAIQIFATQSGQLFRFGV